MALKRDPRDRTISSQRSELARLEQENKRLRQRTQAAPSRRAAALAALTSLLQPKETAGEKVLQPLTPPLRFARQMGAAIVRELREMTIETRRLIRSLAKGPKDQAMDAPPPPYDKERWPRGGGGASVPDEAQRRLEALKERYRQRFLALGEEWSRRMIAAVTAQSTAQLNIGLKDVAERMEIHATMAEPRLRAIVEASTKSCAQLITRIPEQYLGEVQVAVMSAITTGSGLDKLVPYLTKRYEGDARHAHLTALDQVRKASENINAARVQALGSEEYVWIHVGGERYPRPLHVSYSGKKFRYDDPPIIDERTQVRGKPGDAIGCRCRQRAIFRFARNSS